MSYSCGSCCVKTTSLSLNLCAEIKESSSDRAEYTMNDNGIEISLEVISEEKDLGVWMDDRLKFSTPYRPCSG